MLENKKHKPYRIKASPNDNLNYLLRNGTDQQINFVFYLKGRIDENVLKKAVRLSMDAEPVLGCKFVKGNRRTYWERRDDIDNLDYFVLIETETRESDIKNFVIEQIDPCIDCLLKIRVFRNSNDILVIKSDHSVMDGGGFYDYLTLLCSIYNELLENPNYSVEPNINSSRQLDQVLKLFNFITKIKSLVMDKGYTPKWSFPQIGKGRENRTYTLRKINQDRFHRIKSYGKKRNATLNDMFLTAAFRALFILIKPNPRKTMTIAVPTDLRVLIPNRKAETISNLVSTTFVNLKYNPNATFDEVLCSIIKQMKRKKELHLGLGQSFMMNKFFKFRFRSVERVANRIFKSLFRRKKMHPIITNVGMIDSKKRNFGTTKIIDAHIVTPINWAPNFSMGISSYNKRITISIGYCEDSYDNETINYFLDLFLQELPL